MAYILRYSTVDECTEMFTDALPSYGTHSVECRCGIIHYAKLAYHDIDDNFSSTLEPESDLVKHWEYETIISYEIEGSVYVDGCAGCNKRLSRYETFIWDHRDLIRDYLKIRIDQEKKWADQEHLKNIIAGIV